MRQIEILSPKSNSKYSKPFKVDAGHVVVISSSNFACPVTDDIGDVTKAGDCAILHKIELVGDALPQLDGCVCACEIDKLSAHIVSSEPVVQCGFPWTHTHACNLSVLSVPGIYMFEVCNESSIGSLSIKVEELTIAEAALIPSNLYHGS